MDHGVDLVGAISTDLRCREDMAVHGHHGREGLHSLRPRLPKKKEDQAKIL